MISEAVQITLIVSVPAYVMAGIAAYGVWLGRKNGKKIDDVHLVLNSRLDQLLNARAAEAKAEGVSQERSETRQRVAEKKDAEAAADRSEPSMIGAIHVENSPELPKH